ncbi:MAG: hypothetical protein EOP62_13170 [Sphingomonadales bacterium]|nr:MAG: hypothetical protein EOP62_13170 [Sphingomonadales bacterium]
MRNNVILLLLAFLAGQGTLFLAQSWLVARGELVLVGRFGAAYLLISLAYYVVDWGGMIVLARRELAADEGETEQTDRFFWNLSGFRAFVAVALSIGLLGWAAFAQAFDAAYIIAALPALWVGALNFGGLLDGVHRSGLNGLSAAAPMIAGGLVLPLAEFTSPGVGGALLGGTFAVGTLVGTAMQVYFLKAARRLPAWHRPSAKAMLAAAREGWVVLLTLLPVYTFYRGQVAICSAVLGPAATGLFVYSKQVVNAVLICNQFVRRAEFPALVKAVGEGINVYSVLVAQRITLAAGFLLSLGLLLGGVCGWLLLKGEIASAALLAGSFAPATLASALYSTMHQAHIAAGRATYVAAVGIVMVVGGLAVSVVATIWYGIYGFIVAETIMNSVACVVLILLWTSVKLPRGRSDA